MGSGGVKMSSGDYEKLKKRSLRNIAKGELSEEAVTLLSDIQADLKILEKQVKKLIKQVATIDKRSQVLWVEKMERDMRGGSDGNSN